MNAFQQTLTALKIVPVVTPYTVESTVAMTKAMMAGGINSVEITLRTGCAWEAIAAVQALDLPIKVGVGTITNAELFLKAADLNVDFAVSPGVTTGLLDVARESQLQLLPGIASASELMLGLEYGIETFKLFPAMAINAPALLSAFAGPFPDVKFCPTGGINAENASAILAMPNVVCVGGSWMIPKQAVETEDWDAITDLSRRAMSV